MLVLILFDLSATFDPIDHSFHLETSLHFQHISLSWFSSFFIGPSFSVFFDPGWKLPGFHLWTSLCLNHIWCPCYRYHLPLFLPLNSRLVHPTACLTSPLGCLRGFSNLTCLNTNSQSPPLAYSSYNISRLDSWQILPSNSHAKYHGIILNSFHPYYLTKC